jgi:hypothetical protein
MKKQAWMLAGMLVLLAATAGPASANPADYEATRPHYVAALQGNADAQAKLGTLYQKGAGVPQSDALAFQWFLRAAQHNHAEAQLALSGMFANGQGVIRHDVLAYKWAALAETNAGEADVRRRAAEMINSLARRMPEPELAQARKLAGTSGPEAPLASAPAPVPESALDLEQPSTFELAAKTTSPVPEPARSQQPATDSRRPAAESRQPPADERKPATTDQPRREPSDIRAAERRPGRLAQMREELEMAHRTLSLISFGGWE